MKNHTNYIWVFNILAAILCGIGAIVTPLLWAKIANIIILLCNGLLGGAGFTYESYKPIFKGYRESLDSSMKLIEEMYETIRKFTIAEIKK